MKTLPRCLRFTRAGFKMADKNDSIRSCRLSTITADSKCVGCGGIGEALKPDEIERQRSLLIPNWTATDNFTRLRRSLKTKNFATALEYINKIGEIAEAEQHHPDLTIRAYNHVDIVLWTHALGGVTENDLIMAVKIDTIPFAIPKSKSAGSHSAER